MAEDFKKSVERKCIINNALDLLNEARTSMIDAISIVAKKLFNKKYNALKFNAITDISWEGLCHEDKDIIFAYTGKDSCYLDDLTADELYSICNILLVDSYQLINI